MALKLSATLLNTLGHAYVQFALDFVGVYDGKLLKVRKRCVCVGCVYALHSTCVWMSGMCIHVCMCRNVITCTCGGR